MQSAFEKTQEDLIAEKNSDRSVDVGASGSTVTIALLRREVEENRVMLYLAHVGDSRAVLGSIEGNSCLVSFCLQAFCAREKKNNGRKYEKFFSFYFLTLQVYKCKKKKKISLFDLFKFLLLCRNWGKKSLFK